MYLYFLKMDGVPSKSDYAHHADWMKCNSFDLIDQDHHGRVRPANRNSDIERIEMKFDIPWGSDYVKGTIYSRVVQMNLSSQLIASAVLEMGLKNGDANFTLVKRVRMTDVTVDAVQSTDLERGMQITLSYAATFEFGPGSIPFFRLLY